VHFIWPNGKGALLTGIEKQRPTYERLRSVLQGVPGSMASRSWLDRVNPFSRVQPTLPEASACHLAEHKLSFFFGLEASSGACQTSQYCSKGREPYVLAPRR